MITPTDNPYIFEKSKHPHFSDWLEWFELRLGKPRQNFIGEYGALKAYKTRLKNASTAKGRVELDSKIRKSKKLIGIMESLIGKGWTTPRAIRADKELLDHNEQAIYTLLRRTFLIHWYCDEQWDDPLYLYLVQLTRNYVRIKYYERDYKDASHGTCTREASRRTKIAIANRSRK